MPLFRQQKAVIPGSVDADLIHAYRDFDHPHLAEPHSYHLIRPDHGTGSRSGTGFTHIVVVVGLRSLDTTVHEPG